MKTETINVTPHWPCLLRWLEQRAFEDQGVMPDAVAIVGSEASGWYAAFDDMVFKLVDGKFVPAFFYKPSGEIDRAVEWEELESIAYCYKIGDVIKVAGSEV